MAPVKAVFFDAAGTLFHVRGSVGRIYAEAARGFGLNVDPDVLQRSFVNAFHTNTAAGFPAGRERDLDGAERAWWTSVVRQAFGADMPEHILPAYFNRVFEIFRGADAWELYPDSFPALEDLRRRGFRLAVLSNFDSRLYDVLANLAIRGFFEDVFVSWRVGSAKPAPGIFRHALEAMRLGPSEAAHVGDSADEDAAGALGAGLRAYLLDRAGKQRVPPGAVLVRGLDELKLHLV